MSHALAVGSPTETDDRQGLVCDTCGYITFVLLDDEDAVWVTCRPCLESSTTGRANA